MATVLLATLAVVGGADAAQQVARGFGWKHHRSVMQKHSFKISGRLAAPVLAGESQPIDLRFYNPHPYGLTVTKLTVNVFVDPTHTKDGCVRGRDFRSVPMPPASYPIRLRPHQTATLSQLRVAVLPRVALLNLPIVDQSACKGARLTLRFGGRAGRSSAGAP